MKRLFAAIITFTFLFSAFAIDGAAQTRRKKKGTKGLATNIAIVAGSTAAGALIGRGRNGAMIGAGAGLLYASSRKGTKRRYANSTTRRVAKIAGGSLVGAGTGAAIGGKTGMLIGAGAGLGATYLYTRNGKKYYRASNGRTYYNKNGRRVYL
ncbi:MAG: hypothetical protein KIS76_02325 [Pyrinomonadaceae bacterium]|nr:hypothetical protein [Pyrinomonadaceae bacterium]